MRPLYKFFTPVFLLAVFCAGFIFAQTPLSPPGMNADAFRAADGTDLPLRQWLPEGKPRAVILALHGFGDYSAAFQKPATFWAAQGIATYAYDQRGFGGAPHVYRWSGIAQMAADAKTAIALLRRNYPGLPVYLMGESMGGALALVTATGPDAADADGVILVSPAVWEHDFIGSVERMALWVTKTTIPGLWLKAPPGLNIHPSDNIEMLRALSRDALVHKGARADMTAGLMDLMDMAAGDAGKIRLPALVLFGAHEEVLPQPAVEAFLKRLAAGNVRVAYYPQGYHMLLRDLNGDIVWRDVAAWIGDHAGVLPSGDECGGMTASAAPCQHKTD
jgi:alpha-beta hydrolase superfamily lysophospholipase